MRGPVFIRKYLSGSRISSGMTKWFFFMFCGTEFDVTPHNSTLPRTTVRHPEGFHVTPHNSTSPRTIQRHPAQSNVTLHNSTSPRTIQRHPAQFHVTPHNSTSPRTIPRHPALDAGPSNHKKIFIWIPDQIRDDIENYKAIQDIAKKLFFYFILEDLLIYTRLHFHLMTDTFPLERKMPHHYQQNY